MKMLVAAVMDDETRNRSIDIAKLRKLISDTVANPKTLPAPIKFAIIGALGAITNIVVFTLFQMFGNIVVSSTAAFIVSVSQNFFFHGVFTWDRCLADILHVKKYLSFVSGYIVGGIITIAVSYILHEHFLFAALIAQVTAIGSATLFNYIVSYLVLKKKRE